MDKNNPTKNEVKNVMVETYAEDMAKVIQDDKTGLIKNIIHEEEKHEIERKNLSPESKKNKFFILVGFLFIVLGASILTYFILTRDIVPTVPVEKQFVSIIFNDKTSFLEVKDLKRSEIIQTVSNAVNRTQAKVGGLEGIYLTYDKNIVGLRQFLELIKANFEPRTDMSVTDAYINDNFLMGVVNNNTQPSTRGGKDFFILIKVRSVADIFSALRIWENKMFTDLSQFFGFEINAETKYLASKEWVDGIVENKNARILYDIDNKIVMMYIFANDTSIVITNTEIAGGEIMSRLSKAQIKK